MENKKNGDRKKFQKNNLISLPIILFALLSFILVSYSLFKVDKGISIIHEKSGSIFNVEISDSIEEQLKGLMFREVMDTNSGMLFIFKNGDYRVFWMKDTPLSLDIIFLNEKLEVINFYKETKPMQTNERYHSLLPAKYVLEVKTGFIKRVNLEIGDKFTLRNV